MNNQTTITATKLMGQSADTSPREIALAAYKDLMTMPAPSAGDSIGFRRAIMLAVLIGRTLESTEENPPNGAREQLSMK